MRKDQICLSPSDLPGPLSAIFIRVSGGFDNYVA